MLKTTLRGIGIFLGMGGALALSTACSESAAPQAVIPAITAALDGDSVRLTNRSKAQLFVRVLDTDRLALMLYAPCDSPDKCQSLPGKTTIALARPGTNVTVYWFRLEPKGDGTYIEADGQSVLLTGQQ